MSHRIGTPSLSIKARAAQAQQVGQGVGFDVEAKVEKNQCFTMVPKNLSNLQFTYMGVSKIGVPPFLHASVRLDTRRSGDPMLNSGPDPVLSTRTYFQRKKTTSGK